MKILLIGDYKTNQGPSNVNREILANCDGKIDFIKSNNKVVKKIEIFKKILANDVIIFSSFGPYHNIYLKFCKMLHKKTVYLMHGYCKYDNEINRLNLDKKIIDGEYKFLLNISFIVCVSKKFKEWMVQQLPEIETKLLYINPGVRIRHIKKERESEKSQKEFIIALSGGNRIIKNNAEVCKAVETLIEKGMNIIVNVYGQIYENNDDLGKFPFVNIKHQIKQKDFIYELQKTDLFIMNTEIESFGLSAAEALSSGCDILISKNCGILDIMKCSEKDLIANPHDINEIATKIKSFQEYSNNKQILESIVIDRSSWKNTVTKILKLCEILNKKTISSEEMEDYR